MSEKYYMPGPVDPKKLKTLAAQAGYTGSEFAASLGVAQASVYRWTSGRQTIKPARRKLILTICRLLSERFGREVLPEELAKAGHTKGRA